MRVPNCTISVDVLQSWLYFIIYSHDLILAFVTQILDYFSHIIWTSYWIEYLDLVKRMKYG